MDEDSMDDEILLLLMEEHGIRPNGTAHLASPFAGKNARRLRTCIHLPDALSKTKIQL
jgi:hypothetical protein